MCSFHSLVRDMRPLLSRRVTQGLALPARVAVLESVQGFAPRDICSGQNVTSTDAVVPTGARPVLGTRGECGRLQQ